MGKISNVILYIIIAITVVIMGLFFFGGGESSTLDATNPDAEAFYVPNYTTLAMNLAFVLLILAAVAAIALALWGFVLAPKQSMKSLLGIGLLAVVVFIAYALSDATPIQLPGKEALFSDAFRLRLADVCLYSSWLLLALAIASIALAYIMKLVK